MTNRASSNMVSWYVVWTMYVHVIRCIWKTAKSFGEGNSPSPYLRPVGIESDRKTYFYVKEKRSCNLISHSLSLSLLYLNVFCKSNLFFTLFVRTLSCTESSLFSLHTGRQMISHYLDLDSLLFHSSFY